MLIVLEVLVVSDYCAKRLRTDSFWLRSSNLIASYLFLANITPHFGAVTRISRPVKLLYREELLGTTNPSVSTDRPKECDACSVAGLQCKPVRDDVRTPAIQGHTVCQHWLACQLPAEESCW